MSRSAMTVAFGALLAGSAAFAQRGPATPRPADADAEDHSIVFELGFEGDWSKGESLHPGGTFAFEVTPVENWLELEFGWAALRSGKNVEMPVDVLFKKPWQISRTVEVMIGAGPEWIHTAGPERGNEWGASAVLDVMFWPRRNIGWYAEPGYEATFHNGTHHGLGVAIGLLIGR